MQENIGKVLRSAREASDISVDDAVYRGRIPRAVVVALEAEDFGFFTSPLYARSFLKQYGDYVGVDVSQWIDDLVPTALIDSDSVESFLDMSEPNPDPETRGKKEVRENSRNGAMAAVWLIVITGGLIWFGAGFFKKMDEKLSTTPPPARQDPPVPDVAEVAAALPEEKPVATVEPEAPKRAIIVNLPEE